jgi:hypothetical protein
MSDDNLNEVSNEGNQTDSGNTAEQNDASGSETRPSNNQEQLLEKIARKYKVKLDGQELEVDEDELLRGYQLRKVSDKRLEEGVNARKQAEALLHMLKTDPKRVLSDPRIGVDVKKFAEDIIYQQIQEEMMTPEQRELSQYKRRVAEYEAQQAKIKQQEAIKEQEMLYSQRRDAYAKDISEALADSGLPKNDFTVNRVIHHMTKAIKSGFGKVTARDVMDLVHTDYVKDIKSLFGSSSEETLMKLLGDEVSSKIRNYDINKFKEAKGIPKSTNVKTQKNENRTKRSSKPLTPSQLRDQIEKKFGLG